MNEMVARVAKVLAARAGESFADREWQEYVPDARAAIEAMREPTEEMKDTACAAYQGAAPQDMGEVLGIAYTAMIDTALGRG